MTEIITKAKINLKEGTVDLEGTETFVSKYLDEFKEKLDDCYTIDSAPATPPVQNSSKKQETKKLSPKTKGTSIRPIPVDLKSATPTLKDFYKEKKPGSNQKKITLFTYYLNKKGNIENVLPGHIVSCYKEIGDRIPLNIVQIFRDVAHIHGWLEPASETGSVKTTISGDNLIEHDLPKNTNDKSNKTTTEE